MLDRRQTLALLPPGKLTNSAQQFRRSVPRILDELTWSDEGLCPTDVDVALPWALSQVFFLIMETGSSDGDCIEEYALDHHYWMELKSRAKPAVRSAWEEEGTWLVPPLALERRLLEPSNIELQLVEGRTRVGVLRGRYRTGLHVAGGHRTWVGRQHPSPA